ncbi:MAG: MBL fold metallo-hydrolase [Flavobacterium sp.]|nr:MBL fold metallo-hydrolase [Flavobacterium sp.]
MIILILTINNLSYAQVDVRANHPIAMPILENATIKIDSNKGYFITEIKDKVYYVTDGIYQMMFIVTIEGVIAVDAPPSIGKNILLAIKEVTNLPVKYVIYSHSHPDHIGSAGLYPTNAQYITSSKSAAELKKHNGGKNQLPFGIFVGGKPVPIPTKTFKDSLTLTVGQRTIKLLQYNRPAHSADDLIIFLPKEKIVMLVDIIYPGWVPFEQVAYAQDIDGYINLQEELLKLNFDTLVAGHWSKLGTKQDVIKNIEYINDIITALQEAFLKVDFNTTVSKADQSNINLLMEIYFDAIAKYAAEKVENKWKNILSGSDVWTYSHARKLLSFVRESGVIMNSGK